MNKTTNLAFKSPPSIKTLPYFYEIEVVANMSEPKRQAGNSTSLAIIEAAEKLFGIHGIEGVSVRQICLTAKVANNSAVDYHFGSKAELVRAIWNHRLPQLDEMRRDMITKLRDAGLERDRHAVMRPLVEPALLITDSDGMHRYASFLGQALRWRVSREIRNRYLKNTPASQEVLDFLADLTADVPREILMRRLRFNICAFFDMITERDQAIENGEDVETEELFLKDGIDMLVAACLRPMPV